MKYSVVVEDQYSHLETIVAAHQELNDEADRLNEKINRTPHEVVYLKKIKRQRLYLKDQIENLKRNLQLKE